MSLDFPLRDLLILSATALVAVVLLMVATAVLAKRLGRVSIVDTVWGLGFITVALVCAVLGPALRHDRSYAIGTSVAPGELSHRIQTTLSDSSHRTWLLFVLVAIWGGRLAWHIARRSQGAGEDPRYEELMARGSGGIIRKVLLPQGLAIWFVSLPLQVSAVALRDWNVLTDLGILLWLVGMAFETIGDRQLAAYKQDPDRGPVMDRGLWRFTRHPNYFGDACVWWGLWLIAASAWPGVLTILSPIAMTYFLVFATGARLLERTMMKRDGYPAYAARTSMFFPLPPKKASA